FVFRLQTVGGFGGKSDQLNAYNVFVGDPGYFEHDFARYDAATRASVTQSVDTYLRGSPRVSLSIVPRGQLSLAIPNSTNAGVSRRSTDPACRRQALLVPSRCRPSSGRSFRTDCASGRSAIRMSPCFPWSS